MIFFVRKILIVLLGKDLIILIFGLNILTCGHEWKYICFWSFQGRHI